MHGIPHQIPGLGPVRREMEQLLECRVLPQIIGVLPFGGANPLGLGNPLVLEQVRVEPVGSPRYARVRDVGMEVLLVWPESRLL